MRCVDVQGRREAKVVCGYYIDQSIVCLCLCVHNAIAMCALH